MHNLTHNVKTVRAANAAAAGQTAVNSAGIDTRFFVGVRAIALLGAINATGVVSMKAQYSDDNGSTDAYSDIEDSSISVSADTDDNKLLIIDIHKPKKRWVRFVITRGTADSVVDGILVELYLPSSAPVTQDTTVEVTVILNAPSEGTA